MLIWLENSTQGISNSEGFHYLHLRLVADYLGHVTTYFCTHAMSKVSPPQGPDMWYLTFYENKVPINHNIQLPLIQILTIVNFVRNCGANYWWKRPQLRCIHHFKSDFINNMHHMRIPGTEPTSGFLNPKKSIFKSWNEMSQTCQN